jgi:hypothetical protein
VVSDITRGTCYRACPNGFFMNEANATDLRCDLCDSPCATCEGLADQCMSCNGNDGLAYVWDYSCFEECPNKTAPDMSTLRCLGCGDNCNQCGTQEGPNCYECDIPFLLEGGLCKVECEIDGNRPNPEKTMCVDKTLFPVIGPIFSAFSLVILITVIIVKRFKKETNLITSVIALVSCVEIFSIMFNLYLTVFNELWKYTAFAGLALFVYYIINIYNFWYIKYKVVHPEAKKTEKVKQKKVK